MIEARLPDGTSLQFPDGTADDVIDRTVQQHVSDAQAQPSIGRSLGLGTRETIEGATSPIVGAADLLTWPGRMLNRALGIPTTAPSDLVQSGLNATGLPVAQTPGEKARGTVIEGAASMLPAWLLPGLAPNSLYSAAGQLAQGAGGAVGGQVASDVAPEPLKPTAALVGGMLGAKGAGELTNLGSKAANFATGVSSPVVDAYRRLDMDPQLAGDVTGGIIARNLQAYASHAPVGSSIVNPVEQKAVNQFGNAVERTATMLGSSSTEQAAGDVLQAEARNWKDIVFPAREDAAWTPVDRAMANATVDPANYRAALQDLTNKLASLPETQKALIPPRVTTLLEAINADVPEGSSMPWDQAQRLRSAIGQVMGVPEIVQSVGQDALKRAYGGISEDMRASADAHGAADAFREANAVSTAGHHFIETVLSKVIRANNPAQEPIVPERATRSILGSGDTVLQAIRDEMPRAADELAAYKLRDMAKATPGQSGATGAETSVGSFLTDLDKLRQGMPNGTLALFGANPDVARRIADLSTVADTMRETAKRLNVSGTGRYIGWGSLVPMAGAGFMAGGLPGAVGAVAAPILTNSALGAAVTNPLLTRFAATPTAGMPVNSLLAGALSNVPDEWQRSRLRPVD